jgi:hypothetical protein
MQVLGDVLPRWHEFYTLLGTAGATLVGLLFVAATVSSGVLLAISLTLLMVVGSTMRGTIPYRASHADGSDQAMCYGPSP